MPPFEFVRMPSRKHVCYVIEEEQTNDAEIASCDSQVANKLLFKHCKSVLSENGDNISKVYSKPENFMTIKKRDSLCSEFKDVSSLEKGNDALNGHFNSGIFSDINRGQDNLSTVTQLPTSLSTNHEAQGQTFSRNNCLVKSGILVMVSSGQSLRSQLTNSSQHTASVSSFPPRCPTIVKIHRKGLEKYAVVTSTRRRLITSSLFLKLKNSHVTESSLNPLQFVIFIQGITGQSFTFEASSPELAQQWMQAFTTASSCSRMVPHCRELPCKPKELYPQHLTTGGPELPDHSLHRCSTHSLALQDASLLPVLSESITEDDEEINR